MKRVWRFFYWRFLYPIHQRIETRRKAGGDRDKLRAVKLVEPYTMVGPGRLMSAYDAVRTVDRENVEGAIVECGVFKGGTSAVMTMAAAPHRRIWMFDSFEGLPEPGALDGEKAFEYAGHRSSGALTPIDQCVGPLETVEKLFFEILHIDPRRVFIRKGWFQDTLPIAKNEIGPIAILRLDGDWYDSTKVCLDNLYDLVAPGGFVLIDDYGYWEGARKAVDEFRESRGITAVLEHIDESALWRVG